MTTTAITPSEKVQRAVESLRAGVHDNLKDLLKDIGQPEETSQVDREPPVNLSLTAKQRDALDRVAEVFGSVVPDTYRMLEPHEVGMLLDERSVLKEVEKMAKSRVDAIRDSILNHSDIEAEEQGEQAPVAKNGHLARTARISSGSGDEEFSVEARSGGVNLSTEALKALSEDPDSGFTHEDYLACTTQTRVFDEHKAMLLLKEKPELVSAFSEATTEGTPTVGVYVRKRKK